MVFLETLSPYENIIPSIIVTGVPTYRQHPPAELAGIGVLVFDKFFMLDTVSYFALDFQCFGSMPYA
jgi:hypothetical protein